MSEELPDPLVSADVDLSRLDGFMLDTMRLLGSELVALSTGDEFKAAVLLWCRAWKQKPAASLPDDDRILASFAGVPLAKWKKLREMALRGFIKCSDGRLYHRVLADDAKRAAEAMRKRHERTIAATEARKQQRDGQRNVRRDDPPDDERNVVPKTGRDIDKERKKRARETQDPRDYAFAGAVIRLRQKDFDTWAKSYHAIPDLKAELQGIDDKLALDPPENWFPQVSGWLRARHEKLIASRPRKSRNPVYGSPEWAKAAREAGISVDPAEIKH